MMLMPDDAPPPDSRSPQSPEGTSRAWRALPGAVRGAWRRLSRMQRRLLWIALLAAVVGGVGVLLGGGGFDGGSPMRIEDLRSASGAPGGQAEFTERQAREVLESSRHWFFDRVAPHLWRMGASFFVAFVLGFMLRQFIKAMAITFGAAIALVTLADWLGWVDWLPKIKQGLTDSSTWIRQTVEEYSELIKSRLPAGMTAAVGFFFGFLRR